MLRNYFITAFRNFRIHGLYSVINVVGLSIGLAATILIILFVRYELSADAHQQHRDEMYRLGITLGIGGSTPVTVGLSSYVIGPDLVETFPEITHYTRFMSMDFVASEMHVQYEDQSLYEKGILLADSNFFSFFSHPVVYGDLANALQHPNVAVLTRSSAERIFGPCDPVGKSFRLHRNDHIQVGAVIENIPDNAHLKFRMVMSMESLGGEIIGSGVALNSYFYNNFYTYIRSPHDLNTPGFRAKLEDHLQVRVRSQLLEAGVEGSYDLHLRPMKDLYFLQEEGYEPSNPETISAKGNRTYVGVFIVIAVFLIAIASINYMNMAIARSVKRSREVGVRKVLGADRKSLMGQFLSESIIVSFLALFVALLWVELSLPFFNDMLQRQLSHQTIFEPAVLGWVLLLTLITGLLAGSYPALYLSGFQPADAIKQQIRLSDKKMFVRKFLVGLQFCISVFMIIATMVILQQLNYMQKKDMGYETDRILLLNVADLEADQREGFKNQLKQLALVESASLANNIPGPGLFFPNWGLMAETPQGFSERMTGVYHVDAAFAEVFGLEMVEGRFFDPEQPTDLAQSVVINESAARLFGWEDPLGKRFHSLGEFQDGEYRRVIGVVKDFHLVSLEEKIEGLVMVPLNHGSRLNLKLVAGADPGSVLRQVNEIWDEWAGSLALRHEFMDDRHRMAYMAHANLGRLFGFFALMCIALSLMGLFGLTGFTAQQKTKEIGIRKVHGATSRDILALLYREYAGLMAAAILLASPLAWFFASGWLAQFAYRIQVGVVPFVVSSVMAFLVSLLTVAYHAWQHTRRNPSVTLQYE